MPRVRHLLCGLLLLSSAADAGAQTSRLVVPGESVQARLRLRAIDRLLEPVLSPRSAAGSIARLGSGLGPLEPAFALGLAATERPRDIWEQAEEGYYYLLHDSGEALAALPDEPLASASTSLQIRRLCHLRIASLPAIDRASYQRRVETEARRLLSMGKTHRDPTPLRQLVDEMFGSAHSGEALDLLGDLAFERGDFEEARHWWRCLAPLPDADDPATLRLPVPNVDVPRIQAKQILALAFQGQLIGAQEELDRFHERYPTAHGPLAGKVGPYSEAVQAAIRGLVKAGIANNGDSWATFAGSDARNHGLTFCPTARLWEDGPSWRVPLPPCDPRANTRAGNPNGATYRIAFHPVITGQQVLIANAHSVVSYHLQTGKPLFRYDLKPAGGAIIGTDRRLPPHFTLTADDKRAYARLGRQWYAPFREGEAAEASYLVCLDLAEPGDSDRTREVWKVPARADGAALAFFEGPPLVRAGRSYIAMSRLVDKRMITAIQCYDSLGRLRWSRDVCEQPEFDYSPAPRLLQNLLTWAGAQLVYCTHAGAIVTVDPWTGQRLWAVRYARRGPQHTGELPPHDVAACVADEGRIFVAPIDSDRLYAIECYTGRVLWEREGLEVVHILGATQGKVLLTTRDGLHAVSAATGLTVWQQPSEGRLAGLGRGLIAGSWLLWPTQDAKLPFRAVTLADGRQQRPEESRLFAEPSFFDPTQLRQLPPGNLAFGRDCLIIAGSDELVGFIPAQRLPPAAPRPQPHVQAAH